MQTENLRKQLRAYSAQTDVLQELEGYILPPFGKPGQPLPDTVPEDQALVATWKAYLTEAQEVGIYPTLQRKLVQLRFPVRAGMSATDAYRQVTRRGRAPEDFVEASGLVLEAPEQLELFLYDSPAGRLPVLVAGKRADFVRLIQALCYRNEPHPIPASMGAALIKGLNNWDRVRHLQQSYYPLGDKGWIQRRDLYQDSLMVLSRIPYSNVPARELGLSEADWLEQSLRIRMAHEGAHYFTLRHFGRMHTNMYDELLADYAGIVAVQPRFRADWFLRFIGLGNYPRLHPDGRLRNYLGQPPLSATATRCLQAILRKAATQLAAFDAQLEPNEGHTLSQRLWTVCQYHLLEIAAADGHRRLLQTYHQQQPLAL